MSSDPFPAYNGYFACHHCGTTCDFAWASAARHNPQLGLTATFMQVTVFSLAPPPPPPPPPPPFSLSLSLLSSGTFLDHACPWSQAQRHWHRHRMQQQASQTAALCLQDFFELGVILLRKKLFTQATRNLEKAKKSWQGEEDELAKVSPA